MPGSRADERETISSLVSVVIVNWNGRHLLDECLESLQKQRHERYEIILVDNGSSDGSAEFIRQHYPDVRLVALERNLGFAGGNNAGIRMARGKYVALLNNDTKVDPGWLESLVRTADDSPEAGMWASKILCYDDPSLLDNTGLLIYRDGLARGRGRLEKDRGQYDTRPEVLFPSGCAGLYRKSVLDEIGLFDEEFFAYADDVDLGLRTRIAGWTCLFVPEARVYHKYSASSSAYSPLKAFLVERNRVWILFKYYPLELILVSPFFTAVRLTLYAYGALTGKGASGKYAAQHSISSAIGVMVRAWLSGIGGLPAVIKKRRNLDKFRRIKRSEMYCLFSRFGMSAAEIALKD